MERVGSLLGTPYFLEGTVVHGRGLGGRKLLPTINLLPPAEKILPPRGVYYTKTRIDGEEYCGITNVGQKPTVHGDGIGAETYLFGFTGDLYGKACRQSFYHYARPERAFGSLEELREQLQRDEENGRAYWRQEGLNETKQG